MNDFYEGLNPQFLAEQYDTPLYVYNEKIFRQRCKELKNLVSYDNFRVNYSIKANSSLALLQIAKEEGLDADAMSPGEIVAQLKAGFSPEQILFIPNNVSQAEMKFALEHGILVSVDSVSQLEALGKVNCGGNVAIRFNPGVGAGHHEKVVTGGKNTKFGVNPEYIQEVKQLLKKYNLKLKGINQHIGSLFMDGSLYVEGAKNLLDIAKNFDELEFIDLGGGFGIPYRKQENEARLDLKSLGQTLTQFINNFISEYGKNLAFKIEPGRYIPAESGVLLGRVHAIKYNGQTKYIGTDLGFNALMRPVLYGSHHDIEVYKQDGSEALGEKEVVTVVGNICESGDVMAKDRNLPKIEEGDLLGVLDAGAYGYVMSSNYNNRLRPAEVLLRNGSHVLIRERDTIEDLFKRQIML